eukprot:scaffold7998_cov417-Prasinococcus_capsulatus_cf.AAC.8
MTGRGLRMVGWPPSSSGPPPGPEAAPCGAWSDRLRAAVSGGRRWGEPVRDGVGGPSVKRDRVVPEPCPCERCPSCSAYWRWRRRRRLSLSLSLLSTRVGDRTGRADRE